jgi:TolA-binding protein
VLDRLELQRGDLSIHVKLLRKDARFVVVLPDGELEVRGTTFAVAVASDATRQIRVVDGTVEVRLRGRDNFYVDSEHPWKTEGAVTPSAEGAPLALPRADTSARESPAGAAPSGTPKPPAQDREASPAPSRSIDSRGTSSTRWNQMYADAIRSYEANRFDDAARKFRYFVEKASDSPEREDAEFLCAVSLARAQRDDEAAAAAERFLGRYPRSIHSKDAALLIARTARGHGDCAKARSTLAPWIRDVNALKAALGACAPRDRDGG